MDSPRRLHSEEELEVFAKESASRLTEQIVEFARQAWDVPLNESTELTARFLHIVNAKLYLIARDVPVAHKRQFAAVVLHQVICDLQILDFPTYYERLLLEIAQTFPKVPEEFGLKQLPLALQAEIRERLRHLFVQEGSIAPRPEDVIPDVAGKARTPEIFHRTKRVNPTDSQYNFYKSMVDCVTSGTDEGRISALDTVTAYDAQTRNESYDIFLRSIQKHVAGLLPIKNFESPDKFFLRVHAELMEILRKIRRSEHAYKFQGRGMYNLTTDFANIAKQICGSAMSIDEKTCHISDYLRVRHSHHLPK